MSDSNCCAAEKANPIVSAVETGMAQLRRKFAPDRPRDASCHACLGLLTEGYVRLRQSDHAGQPIWLHIGPCLSHYASLSRRAAESRLRENGAALI